MMALANSVCSRCRARALIGTYVRTCYAPLCRADFAVPHCAVLAVDARRQHASFTYVGAGCAFRDLSRRSRRKNKRVRTYLTRIKKKKGAQNKKSKKKRAYWLFLDSILALSRPLCVPALSHFDWHAHALLLCAGLIALCCVLLAIDSQRQDACSRSWVCFCDLSGSRSNMNV